MFARAGGPVKSGTSADSFVIINSGNVIIDNSWLWRADHTIGGQSKNLENPVTNGLIVNGNNVIAYGLAVEHVLGDMVVWNGNNGRTYFYQSEMPYDVKSDYTAKNFVSYRVSPKVTTHDAFGIGVYTFFLHTG